MEKYSKTKQNNCDDTTCLNTVLSQKVLGTFCVYVSVLFLKELEVWNMILSKLKWPQNNILLFVPFLAYFYTLTC